jgi:hypothetical protein
LVELTDEGRDHLHRVCVPVIAAEVGWMAGLESEEQQVLIELLDRVQARLLDSS